MDVIIYSPHTPGISAAAARQPAVAIRRAEHQKLTRYGPSVLTVAYEYGGRLGPAVLDAICDLTRCSRWYGKPRLALPSGTTSRHIRRMLDGALLRWTADALLVALGAHVGAYSSA